MSEIVTQDGTATPTPEPTPVQATPEPVQPAEPTVDPTPAPATPETQNQGMVPSYRLRETREAATRWAQQQVAQREQAHSAALEQAQQRIRALAGVEPQENPEIGQIRQQFAQVFPGLAKLDDQKIEKLLEMTERSQNWEQQHRQSEERDKMYWAQYGRNALNTLFESAEKDLGSQLTDDGKQALHSSFFGYLAANPNMIRQFEVDAKSVVGNYWKSISSTLIDPVRRAQAAAAGVTGGAPGTPQDTPSGAVQPSGGPVQPKDLEDRLAGSWAAYKAQTQ